MLKVLNAQMVFYEKTDTKVDAGFIEIKIFGRLTNKQISDFDKAHIKLSIIPAPKDNQDEKITYMLNVSNNEAAMSIIINKTDCSQSVFAEFSMLIDELNLNANMAVEKMLESTELVKNQAASVNLTRDKFNEIETLSAVSHENVASTQQASAAIGEQSASIVEITNY